ncbi:MAG: mucoidy inhibitor MuiA family protein [Roseiarcus sp.]|jgi:uncharacterized protein (TIGR02231 family)
MRAAAISLIAFTVAFPAVAGETDVVSRIDAVTIYPDAAIVTRLAEVDAPAGDSVLTFRNLPLGLDPDSLRVEGTAIAALTIGSVETHVAPAEAQPGDDALTTRLADLRQQRAATQTTIDSLQGKRAMIVRFSQSGPEKLSPDSKPLDVADWSAAWDAVGTALAKVSADLTPALEKARILDDQIAALEAQQQAPRPQAAGRVVTVAVNAAAAARLSLSLSYRVADVGWTPLYDAALKTDDAAGPSMTLTRRAAIAQSTGEDWSDVALTVSTARVARAVDVVDLRGQRIDFWQPEINELAAARPAAKRAAAPADKPALAEAPPAPPTFALDGSAPQPIVAQDAAAQLRTSAYTAAFKAAGRVTLASDGSQKSFVLGRVVVQPIVSVKTAPSVDPVAYVEAHFVDAEDAPILPGRVALIRDGAFVGEGRVGFVAPGDGVDLGFGGDDKVRVDRAPVNRKENEPTWYNQTKIETREFVTSVKNLHAFPVKVQLIDRAPVSENAAIVVELAPATTPPTDKQVGDKRGVMSWTLDLKPGEAKDVRLAYRMKWPADREVVVGDAPSAIVAR